MLYLRRLLRGLMVHWTQHLYRNHMGEDSLICIKGIKKRVIGYMEDSGGLTHELDHVISATISSSIK